MSAGLGGGAGLRSHGGEAVRPMTPSLMRRMSCFVYESMLLFGIGLVPGAIGAAIVAVTGQSRSPQSDAALRVIAFVVYGSYFVWFWSTRGQTLPMQTWHIRVVTLSGGTLSRWRAVSRFLASCAWLAPAALLAHLNGWHGWQALGAVAVGIAAYALLALLQPQRQFWHDVLCGTRLVSVPSATRPAEARPPASPRHNAGR